jgi:hypothetical protein
VTGVLALAACGGHGAAPGGRWVDGRSVAYVGCLQGKSCLAGEHGAPAVYLVRTAGGRPTLLVPRAAAGIV